MAGAGDKTLAPSRSIYEKIRGSFGFGVFIYYPAITKREYNKIPL